ncbi:MAG: ABC transporter permease [Clostridia bacterium]|nr:ABC transporter permease [Clostridia bacterium]
MHSLYAGVVNEVHKLISRRGTIIFLAIIAIFPIISGLIFSQLQSQSGIVAVDTNGFPLILLGIATSFILPLFIFMAAADSFAGETGAKTLKLTLIRPISRFKVFMAKVITLGLYISLMLTVIWVTSLISGLFWAQGFSYQGLYQGVMAYTVSWLPLMVLALMAAALAQGFKTGSGALTLTLVLYLLMKLVPFLYPNGAPLFPGFYTDWYLHWLESSSYDRLYQGLVYLLSGSTLFFTLGYYAFSQKEI